MNLHCPILHKNITQTQCLEISCQAGGIVKSGKAVITCRKDSGLSAEEIGTICTNCTKDRMIEERDDNQRTDRKEVTPYCPIFADDIVERECLEISWQVSGVMKKSRELKKFLKETHRTAEEIKAICDSCPNGQD